MRLREAKCSFLLNICHLPMSIFITAMNVHEPSHATGTIRVTCKTMIRLMKEMANSIPGQAMYHKKILRYIMKSETFKISLCMCVCVCMCMCVCVCVCVYMCACSYDVRSTSVHTGNIQRTNSVFSVAFFS